MYTHMYCTRDITHMYTHVHTSVYTQVQIMPALGLGFGGRSTRGLTWSPSLPAIIIHLITGDESLSESRVSTVGESMRV